MLQRTWKVTPLDCKITSPQWTKTLLIPYKCIMTFYLIIFTDLKAILLAGYLVVYTGYCPSTILAGSTEAQYFRWLYSCPLPIQILGMIFIRLYTTSCLG